MFLIVLNFVNFKSKFLLTVFLISVEFLSQAVFELSNLDELFTLETMQELCQFEIALQPTTEQFHLITPFRHVFSLANYGVCMDQV